MKHLIFALAAGLALTTIAHAEKPLKVIIVSGGCCHDYANQKNILAETLTAKINAEITQIGEDPDAVKAALSKEGWAGDADAVVYNFCDAKQTDYDYIKSVANVHTEGGKGAVMVHCAMHTYHWKLPEDQKIWAELIGAASPGHIHKEAIDVTTTEAGKSHPIMKGIPDNWKTPNGELYKTPKMYDTATVLATGKNSKQEHNVIWVNELGKARVFAITLGHHNETMQDKTWQEVFTRGVQWSAGTLK
jgi:type 1 glutamine amidotransferase